MSWHLLFRLPRGCGLTYEQKRPWTKGNKNAFRPWLARGQQIVRSFLLMCGFQILSEMTFLVLK